MGNQQTKHSQDGLQNHQRLGPVRIVQFKDHQTEQIVSTMQLTRFAQSERVIQNWRSQMIRIDDTQAKQILLLPQKFQFQKGGMCGSSGTIKIIYQNLSYVLKGQILNRFKINRYFEQREIWYLLYNMIRAGNKFQRIKKKIGNMHPNNILINDDGQIKIIATCSIPGQVDNFQLMTQNHQAMAFLAPQQLANDAVLNAKYPAQVNPCLAEVFSIGMTILSAGTLLDCEDVYQRRKQSLKINQNTLQTLLKYFKQRYSLFLSDVVTDMVSINPNNRKHASDIYQMLYQYQNQILDLEPFSPPQRYIIPAQNHLTGNSNYFVPHQITNLQTVPSNVYSSNLHPQLIETRKVIPVAQINQSRMQRSNYPMERSNMPVQIINNSQIPQNVIYSSQYRHLVGPTAQQSGIYAQKQSFVPAVGTFANSSSIMQGSVHNSLLPGSIYQQPMNQSNMHNINNINVAQSNYIPNYQIRN